MTDEERFSRWMETAMQRRGLSGRHLAWRSGVDHSTISRLRRGQRLPTLGTALRLARVLGVESLMEAFV